MLDRPGRIGQNWDHRKGGRVPLVRDRRPVPACTLVWNSDGCIVWNGTHERQVRQGSLVKIEDLWREEGREGGEGGRGGRGGREGEGEGEREGGRERAGLK